MPRKLGLSHKKSHSKSVATTCSSDVPCEVATQTDDRTVLCEVATQTDDRTETIDASTQTDDIPNLLRQTVSYNNVATPTNVTNALHLMSPMPGSCVVQYPIEIFYLLKLESLYQLKQRLQNAKCLDNWFVLPGEIHSEVVKLVKIDEKNVFTVEVLSDLQWDVVVPNKQLFSDSFNSVSLPSTITTIKDLQFVLSFLSDCTICSGNADPKFALIVAKSKGIFKDRSGLSVNLWLYNCYKKSLDYI